MSPISNVLLSVGPEISPIRVLDVVLRTDVIDKILKHIAQPTTRYRVESTPSFSDTA